jgi:hypothetical protein
MVVIGLMAGSAFATTVVTHGVAVPPTRTISLEVMGSARNVSIVPPVGGNAITYISTAAIAAGNLIDVTMTGATFLAATVYNICDTAGAVVATQTPGEVSSFSFTAGIPVLVAAQPISLTTDACAALNTTANVRVSTRTNGGNATIVMNSPANTTIASANLATVRAEYTTAFVPGLPFIDVIAATGEQFTAATGTNSAGLAVAPRVLTSGPGSLITLTIIANDTRDQDVIPAVTTSATVSLTDTALWQGVSRIFLADAACDATAAAGLAGNRVGQNSPTGTVSLAIPAALFAVGTAAGALPFNVCALVDGTSFLDGRIIRASVDISVTAASGVNDPTATAFNAVQTWDYNGALFAATGMKGWGPADLNFTVLSFNNHGTADGAVRRLDVYRIDSTATAANPVCSVKSPTVIKTIFGNAGATVHSNDVAALCSAFVDLTGVAYGVRLVTNLPAQNVSCNGVRVYPGGLMIQNLPVLKRVGVAYQE